MNGFYAAALDRLPVEEMPALIPRLLKAGLCFGFLVPVSNIVVNTISYKRVPERKPEIGGGSDRKLAARRRRKALSRTFIDTSDISYCPPDHRRLRDMSIVFRSLEALVAFLTCYFRYLPTCEALQYLRLAKADLLTAVRLIEQDRNLNAFSFASLTTKTALGCAARAGWHPNPKILVARSYSLAPQIEQVSRLLAMEGCLPCSAVENLHGSLKVRQKLLDLAGVADDQFLQKKNKQPAFVRTKSLKSILLDKIYGLYLDALAWLPRDDLRMRFHRGLLKAGHCYGPLMNPVFNIVLNTVWYETMFPPQEQFSVAMICSRSLVLVACCSLHGLVAFLRTCVRTLSTHQAMRYLLLTEVSLWGAVEMAKARAPHYEKYVGRGLAIRLQPPRHDTQILVHW